MTVYVDDGEYPYGRMVMCHMVADTHEELLSMASMIGVSLRHLQDAGSGREHFDVCKSMRERAVRAGAVEITQRELVMKLREKRDRANVEQELIRD